MLRQVFIILNSSIIYNREFGRTLTQESLERILPHLKNEAFSKSANEVSFFDFYKYKISFLGNTDYNLIMIFISGLGDDFNRIKVELYRLWKEFLTLFSESINEGIKTEILDILDPFINSIHSNLRPKISLIGFSGVGKTTISKLFSAKEIPLEHIPTINVEVTTIKLGKLSFYLWDFAGQEQYSFLWDQFIKESDVVLLITDSTLENVIKSKYFLELIKDNAPHSYSAIIGNKQDLPNALKTEEIEKIMGIVAYSFVAIDTNNRDKLIRIIADVLDINTELSPLLTPIFKRDKLINEAQNALTNGDFKQTIVIFEEIADICLDLGDDALALEFLEKSADLRIALQEHEV